MNICLSRRSFLKVFGSAIIAITLQPGKVFAREKSIPVLMYHDISDEFTDYYTVSPAQFASQMEWLYANGYKGISLKEIDKNIRDDSEKAVVITFDDGYASFCDFAFPVLQQYNFKSTINIIGKHVGSFIRYYSNRPVLSWDEYRYLLESGLVDLGCHTYNLHSCGTFAKSGVLKATEKELVDDILLFRKVFQDETGRKAEILAWPCGAYNRNSIVIAKRAGFRFILTSREGYVYKDSNLDEVPRLNISRSLDPVSFQQYIGETG